MTFVIVTLLQHKNLQAYAFVVVPTAPSLTTASLSRRSTTASSLHMNPPPNGEEPDNDDNGTTPTNIQEVLTQEWPLQLTRMATDLYRRVRWVHAMTPAASAALYMNPVTATIASNLTVSWEPDAAQAVRAAVKKAVKEGKKKRGQPYLVGVVGIPGSGKSTSCDILAKYIGDGTLVMPMDGYHLSLAELAQQPDPADAIYRRGAPDTFAPHRLLEDLQRIKTGKEAHVTIPGFDHALGDPTPDQHTFHRNEHDVVIVEGIYLMHDGDGWETVRDMLDFTIYIEADIDTCIDRLKIRNRCIPGYTVEEIEIRCDAVDRANAEIVARGASRYAELVVQSAALTAVEECDVPPAEVSEKEIEQYAETVQQEAEAIIQELQ